MLVCCMFVYDSDDADDKHDKRDKYDKSDKSDDDDDDDESDQDDDHDDDDEDDDDDLFLDSRLQGARTRETHEMWAADNPLGGCSKMLCFHFSYVERIPNRNIRISLARECAYLSVLYMFVQLLCFAVVCRCL